MVVTVTAAEEENFLSHRPQRIQHRNRHRTWPRDSFFLYLITLSFSLFLNPGGPVTSVKVCGFNNPPHNYIPLEESKLV